MKINKFFAGSREVSEIVSKEILIRNEQDALDLYASIDTEYILLRKDNFENDIFDLKNRKLGEILQKFTNYRTKLAVVGDFSKYNSKALKDFIYESNKHGEYIFVASIEDAKKMWNK